ncbi:MULTISPECIES: hypothetical protein [Brevibacillus]|uniref:hypothetical protein n=1 Tax=Brevibacillus TaxID=55080 RepID=UPI000D0F3582|nr:MULTISPECIES: hypothetical protein [Brevibacillus]PSJ66965.1 hypothetical protein C7J99_23060 [Brevibacillus brevis]RED27756.1 hypothetical protein DES34_10948 [Brevibacillus brevis]TQK42122.1 hypothetical protein FB479_115114 [Brevibacillus sp. AG162]VEF86793.1 Uncharacterised protein [Brevibacillus brevis]GEC88596.1 hypothetical protein BBR01nite_09270 [Brevibacillus brevis]
MIQAVQNGLKSALLQTGIAEKLIYTSVADEKAYQHTPSAFILMEPGEIKTDRQRVAIRPGRFIWQLYTLTIPFSVLITDKDLPKAESKALAFLTKLPRRLLDGDYAIALQPGAIKTLEDTSIMSQAVGFEVIVTAKGGVYSEQKAAQMKVIIEGVEFDLGNNETN